jgi:hypothetical protein
MEERETEQQPSAVPGRTSVPEEKIIWRDSEARTSRADVTEVAMSREEICLTFGAGQPQAEEADKIVVSLLGRVILTPFTAKRLSVALGEVLRRHEALHGPSGPVPLGEEEQYPAQRESSREKEALLGLVKGLHVEFALERSFKVLRGSLLTNRILLSLRRNSVPRERMLAACRDLGLPDLFWETLLQNLPDTGLVHFGFEENEKGSVYKVYLELSLKSRIYPFLLYLGFKWDPADHRRSALARYTCYPSLTPRDMIERLSLVYEGWGPADSIEIAKGIVREAAAVTQDILYMDVTEDNNPRRSFDINMYGAGLRMEALYPLLMEMSDRYLVARQQFQTFFETVKARRFGHLSGGTDREGRDFFTLHYGVEEH